jgi:hypothetical protein
MIGRLKGASSSPSNRRPRDCQLYGFLQATPRRSWIMDNCHAYNGVMLSRGLTNTPFTLTSTASAV